MTTNKDLKDGILPVALEYFKPPFKYENIGQTIYCTGANGQQMCLQVRGWGNLIGGGANALPHEKAQHVQDEFGQWVADALNDAVSTPAIADGVGVEALKYFNALWFSIEKHMGVDPDCAHWPDVIRAAIMRNISTPPQAATDEG